MYALRLPIMVLVLSPFLAVACHRDDGPAQTDRQTSTDPSAQRDAKAVKAPVWPDGYIVVSEEEWIPVVNPAGEKLAAARKAFVAGDTRAAAESLRAAAKAIGADTALATVEERSALERDEQVLDRLADQLASGAVEREAFERALTDAYRRDATVTWLHLQDEAFEPFLERPSGHTQAALAALARNDNEEAAAEIRRAAAFFRLAAQTARDDDRELLQHNVDRMNQLATRAEAGKLTAKELRAGLAKVDAAYAASYLHQAEDDYMGARQEVERAPRALLEATARMRSRLRLLDQEMEATSKAVVDELERLTDKLHRGERVGERDATAAFKRARKQVEPDAEPSTSSPMHAEKGR